MTAASKVFDLTDLLDRRHIGILIGKNGFNLKRIQNKTKAILQMERKEGDKTIKLCITGLPLAVEAARIEIHELLLQILRKNGHRIENIKSISGAQLDLGWDENGFTSLKIYGDYRRIVLATNMVKERLDTFSPTVRNTAVLNKKTNEN
ncbi:unnamed protein product [Strongylus vulgaris]|uniref:K Homology domain-containing protein n=1 Tax=Strongylus vulgaris TaxID=40348 RepID=A0A3P7ID07_STRVU|nr:unnamed protein product [Strongylus vulgaris]